MIMRHLIWKDGMAIRPLVSAILVGIVAIFALLALVTTLMDADDAGSLFVSCWVLMPNLVALGAPALLVGSEEESGTLSWLRTLPVEWQKIADAKLIVSVAAVAVAWIASSLMMLLARFTVAGDETPYVDAMLQLPAIAYLLFFSALLLICGFITAYLFRSPIAGLFALVPLIAVVNTAATGIGRGILTGDFRYQSSPETASPAAVLAAVAAGVVAIVLAWGIQRMLARRRLTSPQTHTLKNLTTQKTVSAYRPPMILANTSRPAQTSALLWQHLRQTGLLAVGLTVITGVFLISYFSDLRSSPFGPYRYSVANDNRVLRTLQELSPAVIVLGASWLGGLAFYGDNVRRRCMFFADRGIAPTIIWWTRLLLPSVCCLLLVGIASLGQLYRDQSKSYVGDFATITTIIVVYFAFGQLIGQWMRRGVMTFLVAPAYSGVATLVLFVLLNYYPNHYAMAALVLPVLLFASWRLSSRWLRGSVDYGYAWRVLGYTVLAVLVPIIAIVWHRISTTPDAMPQWRASMLAITKSPTDYDSQTIDARPISPDVYATTVYAPAFEGLSNAEKSVLLQQERDSEGIGEFVSLTDIDTILNSRSPVSGELQKMAIEVLLKWARQVRRDVVAGKYGFYVLSNLAEIAEYRAVTALENLATRHDTTPALAKLVRSIPDRILRTDSRRVGLINEWQAFHARDWAQKYQSHTYYGKSFFGRNVAESVAVFAYERTRADRYIDRLTRLMLDQLAHGLPESQSSPGFVHRGRLWIEAMDPRRPEPLVVGRSWTQQYENRIDRLKSRYAAP